MTEKRIVLGVSGASGMEYALALARHLAAVPGLSVHGIISAGARQVLEHECVGYGAELETYFQYVYAVDNVAAPPASGSWHHDGMVICPCSMASLAAIAQGVGTHLLHRAADVCLKERRPLVLVVRETPLSAVHLRNMLRAHQAGAIIMPACPGFYHQPRTLDDIVRHFAGRVMEQLGLPHTLYARWGETESA